jgi:hypothetical protein
MRKTSIQTRPSEGGTLNAQCTVSNRSRFISALKDTGPADDDARYNRIFCVYGYQINIRNLLDEGLS